jgi:hypothetical protein
MEDKVAAELGRLMLVVMKQTAMLEQAKAEIDKRDAEIAKLKEAAPELPLAAAKGANGHDNHAH